MMSVMAVCIMLAIILLPFAGALWVQKRTRDTDVSEVRELIANKASMMMFERKLTALKHELAQHTISEQAYDAYKRVIEKQLLAVCQPPVHRRRLTSSFIGALVVLLCVVTLGIYCLIPRPHHEIYSYWKGLQTYSTTADQILTGVRAAPPDGLTQQQSISLFQALLANAQQHPVDWQRWQALSDILLAVGAQDQAIDILRRNYVMNIQDSRAALFYAQRLIELNAQMPQQAANILQAITAREPNNQMAVMLLATGYFKNQQYAQAAQLLEHIRQSSIKAGNLSENSLTMLDETIALAQHKAAAHVSDGTMVAVRLSTAARAQITPQSALYVIAHSRTDKIPYAVSRIAGDMLTQDHVEIVLSDASAMMTDRTVSSAKQQHIELVLEARLSLKGNPIAQAGDWVSAQFPFEDQKSYILEINQPFTP